MKKFDKNVFLNFITMIGGVTVNFLLSFLMYKMGLPMYLDSIGTIATAAVCGMLPGILVAVATNLVCCIYNPLAIYYAILSVLMAIVTSIYTHRNYLKKKTRVAEYLLILALIAGGLGAGVQLLLLHHPQYAEVSHVSEYISTRYSINVYVCFFAVNIILNLIDKGLSAGIVFGVLRLVPQKNLDEIWDIGWQQRPLSAIDMKRMKIASKKNSAKLQKRVSSMLITAAITMSVIMSVISVQLFYSDVRERYIANATGAVKMAAKVINPDRIDAYVIKGHELSDYIETENALYDIRANFEGVEYLYVIRMKKDGCQVVFDLATEEVEPYDNGDMIPFEEAFEPYMDDLFAGKEIEPVESDDISGWIITKYYPVKDAEGNTVCYVAADVQIKYLSGYLKDYIIKTFLIFSGFFLLILAYGMWLSRYHLVYPINSMAAYTSDFMTENDNQAALEENVRRIKALDIHTGDEIENLYKALCKMTESTAEKMKDVRQQAKAINQMQSGLIITMADLVENRDSDTGYHILKTADYVKIILEGLQKKGYYSKKLTPKFIADVEMSAPLHDIGKINIPDAVLNKPGKLTDEEYEIMKTHTTAGKQIMEKAISTVKGESYLKEARNMAAYHHEKWDGSGYPEGLKGEVIPLSARIMAVADVFDALTARRVYKEPMPFEKAMGIIIKDSGTHFDPKCVEVFAESEKEVRRVLKKYQE
ncbi:HD domain-containing protein [Pseudobutyrivibrio sp. JW11]|uniref:HD domain-containing phosphohydrolase n=1 Tax=Pseudobutyrivibrio sp. JW11 TaxID=1855302 RepID=UPI0008EFE58C|nr:HD domain-containing phosphohydrolase [Pseudobutyrivibrio sp. JW11]SFO12484.1 HD domain-containing protein [Pseudobutyrivibrio sp. JW11]